MTSLVSFVPATTLEAQKANAADASMLCQQNFKTMYFKTLNPRLFNLDSDLRFGFSVWLYAYKCCKFSTSLLGSCTWEFWMELKKIKVKAFVHELRTINNLTYRKYLLWRQFNFLKLNRKKNSQLICFIEITSILAHEKTQLSQTVKPYSLNVVKRRGF